MEAVRRIIETTSGQIIIDLPESYRNRKVEVIILPMEENHGSEAPKKYDFSKFFGKLEWQGDAVAEQRRLRDEWD